MIVLVMGVSGSGKTTIGASLASVRGCVFVDADDYHSPANRAKMARGEPLTDEDRAPWLALLGDMIGGWLAIGAEAVMACSALRESYRRLLLRDPVRMRVVYLKGDYALIVERLARRTGHFMPPSLLQSQFDTLEEPAGAIVVKVDDPPEAIVAQIQAALE